MASTEQDKNLKEFVLRVPDHTDCHFRFDACFRAIDGTDTSMFREFPKRRNDGNHQLEVPNWHLKPDLDL
jgi:hypothetical protein